MLFVHFREYALDVKTFSVDHAQKYYSYICFFFFFWYGVNVWWNKHISSCSLKVGNRFDFFFFFNKIEIYVQNVKFCTRIWIREKGNYYVFMGQCGLNEIKTALPKMSKWTALGASVILFVRSFLFFFRDYSLRRSYTVPKRRDMTRIPRVRRQIAFFVFVPSLQTRVFRVKGVNDICFSRLMLCLLCRDVCVCVCV